jgi:hypothetical protein
MNVRHQRHVRPQLEPLEERWAPSASRAVFLAEADHGHVCPAQAHPRD